MSLVATLISFSGKNKMKRVCIALALFSANFGVAYLLLKGAQSPDMVALLVMGFFPGFVFSSLVFPGIHADLNTQVFVMSSANAATHLLAYKMLVWLIAWIRSKRKSRANDPTRK